MIVDAIFESIRIGIVEIDHFEEIGILNEGFGCDRISDATVQILKQQFIEYTSRVCRDHNILMRDLPTLRFNTQFKRWEIARFQLPENPFHRNRPVILIPKEFLRNLPTLDKEEFWDYCWDNYNEILRNDFNVEVKNQVNKKDIIDLARQNRSWIKDFIKYREDISPSESYDLGNDPKGVYQWAGATTEYVEMHPVQLSANDKRTFDEVVEKVIGQFVLFIEDNGGFKLLWNDKSEVPKSEEAAQLIFLGIVKQYCIANNIDLSKEVNVGRGPVDFKFSRGYRDRVLIELKLAKSTKFWRNLKNQLSIYLRSEEIRTGYFVVICYSDKDILKVNGIEREIEHAIRGSNIKIKTVLVDARKGKPSASNVY